MARVFVTLLALTLAAAVTQGALHFMDATNPALPGMCDDRETNVFPEGSTWYLKGCVRAHCASSGGRMFITHATCSPIHVPGRCKQVTDESLVYPSCCPRLKCQLLCIFSYTEDGCDTLEASAFSTWKRHCVRMAGVSLLLLLMVALAAETQAYTGITVQKYQGSPVCYDRAGVHPEGSSWYLDGCEVGRCSRGRDGDVMVINYVGCGKVAAPDGCEMVQDLSLNYPDCCPKSKCP
ncbi:uncharacterized protein LOC134767435 [Penaeus indicus]|uniref:uncharacterized protein LOC134767435 n=1 Tax=Penaeus indicus TaxID=29960 RepID=UPI00300CB988